MTHREEWAKTWDQWAKAVSSWRDSGAITEELCQKVLVVGKDVKDFGIEAPITEVLEDGGVGMTWDNRKRVATLTIFPKEFEWFYRNRITDEIAGSIDLFGFDSDFEWSAFLRSLCKVYSHRADQEDAEAKADK